jgi:photosystem II stability/assembly factor-like uncharacterized protein
MKPKIIFAMLGILFLVSCVSQPVFLTPTIIQSPLINMPTKMVSITDTPNPWLFLAPYITDLHMFDEQNGWAFARNADYRTFLFRSEDGGQTWKFVYPCDVIRNYFFLSDKIAWVIGWYFGDANPKLYRTIDGGQTWSFLSSLDEINEVYFADINNGWAKVIPVGCDEVSCDITLYKTFDGGKSWSQLFIHDPLNRTTNSYNGKGGIVIWERGFFSFRNDKNFWAFAGNESLEFAQLSVTWNGGQKWEQIKLSLPSIVQDPSGIIIDPPVFLNNSDAYLPVRYGPMVVFSTHDGGHNWNSNSAIVQNVAWYSRVDFVSLVDGFVLCGDNICSTHDGAQSWRVVSPNINFFHSSSDQTRFLKPEIDFVKSNIGFALIPVGDISTSLYETQDGGATWSIVNIQFK